MKKILITLGILGLIAAGCENANKPQEQLITYTNSENGYTMQIPEDWAVIDNKDGSNNLLGFVTRDKHTVYLKRNNFGPMDLPPVPQGAVATTVGAEAGYLTAFYHCGDGTPNGDVCTGSLNFESPSMSRRGFSLEFHIEQVEEGARKNDGPRTDFAADIKDIETVLKTFQLDT